MPTDTSNRPGNIGAVDDDVVLTINGTTLAVAESYQVTCTIFSQPAAFAIRTGSAATAAELMAMFPPGSKFQLTIGGNLAQTGTIDDIDASDSSGGTEVTIKGRDAMAPLQDGYVDAVKSFSNSSYLDIVKFALGIAGLQSKLVSISNAANRALRSGVPLTELAPPAVVTELIQQGSTGVVGVVVGTVKQQLQANLGETLQSFVRRYLDRAGLMLWADAQGNFVLSTPNIHQPPVARILRLKSGQTTAQVSVERASLQNTTSHRHSEVVIYGRGGGRKAGAAKMRGTFQDAEMVAYGFDKPLVVRDKNTQTAAQAVFLARRRLAEERRAGYVLTYVVTGHTVPSLVNGQRCTWCPDTVVDVQDDILDVHGTFYLETAEYQRGPEGTTTTLKLSRTADMTFGEVDEN